MFRLSHHSHNTLKLWLFILYVIGYYVCYLRPDSLLAVLMDDLVYTNNMLAMVNAAIGAMNFRGFISRIWVFWVTMGK
ncbi:hypothetical protein J3E68DRAFT_407766 [Trichoderma sp. SZMC 28012]